MVAVTGLEVFARRPNGASCAPFVHQPPAGTPHSPRIPVARGSTLWRASAAAPPEYLGACSPEWGNPLHKTHLPISTEPMKPPLQLRPQQEKNRHPPQIPSEPQSAPFPEPLLPSERRPHSDPRCTAHHSDCGPRAHRSLWPEPRPPPGPLMPVCTWRWWRVRWHPPRGCGKERGRWGHDSE